MIRKSFVFMGLVVSGCGACYASSHTGLHTECIHDDCHPMSGMDKSLERFMKMEEEFISSVECFGNHLNNLEKLDMRLSAQESYIRSIRLKLQGLIHGSAGVSNGYAGMPNIQNNLNSQTVINNQTTMNTNNTCINNNFMQNVQQSNTQISNFRTVEGLEKEDPIREGITGFNENDKARIKYMFNCLNSKNRKEILPKWPWLSDPKIIAKP